MRYDYLSFSLKALGACFLLTFSLSFFLPNRDANTLPIAAFSSYSTTTSMPLFEITSPAFANMGSIPAVYSRSDGDDRSPPLQWSNIPPGTKSLALIVDDPDAPDPKDPKMTWVHWVLYNIPPEITELPEGVSKLPGGTLSANNDWKKPGYGGPSPPKGVHRYFHKLYALDSVLPNLGSSATKASVLQAMEGHVLGRAELIGTYKKGGGRGS